MLCGQLLVALVFGELASRFPYAGSVYQWARHVKGTTWGWTAAWAYIWGLTLTLSTMAYAAAGFILEVCGVESPSRWLLAAVSIGVICFTTAANMIGRQVLKVMIVASIICEVVGSVGLGTVLVNFSVMGPYIAFAVPVFAAALTRLAGRWVPGVFSLGRWGAPVTYAAAAWLAFEVISLVSLGIVGAVVYARCRHRITEPVGERL